MNKGEGAMTNRINQATKQRQLWLISVIIQSIIIFL